MRVLHTSDWHFGMPLKIGTMIDDQRYFLEQLYSIIKEENVDVVICAGDVYDSGVANAEAIDLYNEAVTTICMELNKKMVVIAGNHDSGARLAACNELLEKAGLYVSGRLSRDVVPVSIDNADIYQLPFFNRDEVRFLFPEKKEEIKSTEDAFKVVCDHIRENMDPSKINIIVSHAFIVNAELSVSDRSAQLGQATAVSKDVFEGFDYVALGHIHKPQKMSENIRYSGSPIKYSFGNEETQIKQVVIFDTITKEQKEVPLKMLHERISLNGTYDEIITMENNNIDYINITVTDRIASLQLLTELRGKYPNILELHGMISEVTGVESSIDVDEIQQMSDKDIMLRFLMEQYDYTPTEDEIQLFDYAVEHLDEEDDQ